MKKVIQFLVITLVVVSLNSCKKVTKKVSDVNAYSEFISGFPEDRISATSNFKFVLQKPVDVTQVSNDVLTITPKIKGTVTLNNNTIIFTPHERLKNNEEYSMTLHLSKLYNNIDPKLKDFICVTKTKELLLTVALQTPLVYDKNWNFVNGSIDASDLFETEKLPKMLTAMYDGKSVPIKYEAMTELASNVQFRIDSINRFEIDKKLKVQWNGKPINSISKGEDEVNIVGKDNFQVMDINITNGDKQQIDISFSDPLKTDQDLKGFINFLNQEKREFTYKVSNNVLSIYPKASFKEKAEIEIFKGIKNVDDYTLKENVSRTLYFEQLKPALSFIKSGTILPNSKNLKINFTAVNLRAVDVTLYKIYKDNVLQFLQQNDLDEHDGLQFVGRPVSKYTVNLTDRGLQLDKPNVFAVDLADMVRVEEGVMYRVELSFNQDYSNYSCDNKTPDNTITYGKKDIDIKAFDSDRYYYYGDDYYWNERNDPCTNSFYYDKTLSTNILASNLGAIVKKGSNNTTFVAVTDLLTARPVSGAKVELFNMQQQPLISSTTNNEGIAEFYDDDHAFFAVISNAGNTTYIKLNDGNALSMSKFDVSGKRLQDGIQGFIYGERGVWRPGDTMYLTFVLNDNANPIPEKHPIKFELYNPQGKLIDRYVQSKNSNNVYAYTPKTQVDAMTGNWRLEVSVGSAKFNKTLNVETIKPNRLKIKINMPDDIVKSTENISGEVDVKWLHGAIAKSLKLDITGKFYRTKTEFDGFKSYNFDDITRPFATEEFKVLDGQLDANGTTKFSIKPNLSAKAPGMLKASFITKVYENGGDFSTDVVSQKVSPYKSYVGLNPAEEKKSKNYLFTGETYTFDVASVNENGKGFANELEVNVYKLEWRWWWRSTDNGLYDYDGTQHHEAYYSKEIKTNISGKGNFKLKIDKNDWGRYLIKVKDKNSGHSTANVIYFDWPSWYGRKIEDKSNATMLVFNADKENYNVNEKATIKFPSSKGNRALVTIENGTEVLDYYWVTTDDKQTAFQFPVKGKYAPNVFVNVSLLQPHAQTVNDLPIRMYGSVPIGVKDPTTELHPELMMADEVRPETKVSVKVKEKNGKPMTYTIAIVDEGLLDLTRYKTPNPWDAFFAKQSLGVRTWDIFDDVIGAFGGKINQVLSIGGDEAGLANSTKKANRFKPMVVYLGPFELKPNATAKHEIEIPQYVGSVRAMVIANDVSNNAFGNTEKAVFVRKPVMLLASLPRKITPKETVTLPVSVFAMTPEVKNIKVTLQPNDAYEIIGDKTQQVDFNQPDEKMIYYHLKVKDYKGIGNIVLNASSGKERATYKVEIDVLNPNPLTTETIDLILKAGEKSNFNFDTFGTKGTNEVTLEFSTLPPMNFTKRLEYLIKYPHGCVEQTTSSAFPQLYFPKIFDLSRDKRSSIERNVKATIIRLYDFQRSSGGLSYWQGNSHIDDWGTSYAGHFMIEAEKQGYALPIGFKDKWIKYQKQAARQWRFENNTNFNNSMAQAYRLYTLSLANSPDLASMNRLRETSDISNEAKMRLASAYALIGKKSIANSILKTLTAEDYTHRYYHYYGSEIRNKAMSLETYTLLDNQEKAIKLAQNIAKNLSGDKWMSTQTTAYALMAMSKYALENGSTSGIDADFNFNGKKQTASTSKAMFAKDLDNIQKSNTLKVTNNSKAVLYARVFNKGILPVGEEKVVQKNLEAKVVYKTKDGSVISVGNLSQGTNFVSEITIKNLSNENVDNIALTQYIPSGWEIINTRFTDFGDSTTSSDVDYTDIRDDRISYYFTLNKRQSKTFRILLNASYLGNYYLPGIQCEAMYDHDYLVRNRGKWVEVVK